MNSGKQEFFQAFSSLLLRLITIGAVAVLFALTPKLLRTVEGWPYIMTKGEIAFELLVYMLVVALGGAALGALCALAAAPLLLREASRERIAEGVTRIAVVAAAFVDFRVLLGVLIARFRLPVSWERALFDLYYLAFLIALCIPRTRREVAGSLDGLLTETTTRRTAIGLGIATVAVAIAERAIAKPLIAPPALTSQRPGRNLLLITFDALSAEDMSLYGYPLPTTPHLDEFARRSSVFTSFYSTSTFTTPSVASVLTGLYPTEHRVYHIPGRLHGDLTRQTLPHLMRAAGFATGASISSPYVYFLNEDLSGDYDVFPDMKCFTHDVRRFWNSTKIFHQTGGISSPAIAFVDMKHAVEAIPEFAEEHSLNLFLRLKSPFPPRESFAQAREVLDRLPDGFFLWIHVMAPHEPCLPDAPNLGRFLPADELKVPVRQERFAPGSVYSPSQQRLVDKARLRYDEFLADADDAFGAFMTAAESSGRLRNTAVIVSADHGESFQGGVYTHKSKHQTRPEIHIPLIVRTPGQENGQRVHLTADQTALAPTILELAGLPRPNWMQGESLVPWLNRDGEGSGQGAAFTQYLETNSICGPLKSGTVGVITGGQQYVIDLSTGQGILRSLDEAESRDRDRSTENPALAETLRGAIYARFPNLRRKRA